MCVSNKICQQNLKIILSFISGNIKSVPIDIKQTIICALGDLLRRFTNMIEDESGKIYELLRDDDALVR